MLLSLKGAVIIYSHIFPEVYEPVQMIHSSEHTEVWIVRHINLNCLRIIKCIKKAGDGFGESEAEILKDLRHPGIPMLYDLVDAQEVILIIEEYIKGQSLQEYLLNHTISQNQIVLYALQLCEIIEYLHCRKPYPILYQDLKPEHVIICGDQIKIIDYGIACFLSRSGKVLQQFGTEVYTAPEQRDCGVVDERADIYSLGKVLFAMKSHMNERCSGRVQGLIEWAIEEDVDKRPESISKYKLAWQELERLTKREYVKNNNLIRVAVVGNAKGVGTTHVAIGLTTYLNSKGRRAIYRDLSNDGNTQRMLRNSKEFGEKDGVIYHDSFRGTMEFGPAIANEKTPCGLQVLDCGIDISAAKKADMCIYVGSSRPWKSNVFDIKLALNPHCYILVSPASMLKGILLAKELGKKVYGFPLDIDPFHNTKAKSRIFEGIWKQENEEN